MNNILFTQPCDAPLLDKEWRAALSICLIDIRQVIAVGGEEAWPHNVGYGDRDYLRINEEYYLAEKFDFYQDGRISKLEVRKIGDHIELRILISPQKGEPQEGESIPGWAETRSYSGRYSILWQVEENFPF